MKIATFLLCILIVAVIATTKVKYIYDLINAHNPISHMVYN